MPIVSIDTREGHFGVTLISTKKCYGVEVDAVHPKDLFALAGIRAGMVMTKIDGRVPDGHPDAMYLLEYAAGKQKKVVLEVMLRLELKTVPAHCCPALRLTTVS